MIGHSLVGAVRQTKERSLGLARSGRDCLADSHTLPAEVPLERKFLQQVWQTLRYKAAGQGLALSTNERRLLTFANRHEGQRAFVIGNGPSLRACDLGLLENDVTFAVNGIFLADFVPTYYVVEDIFVAEDRADEINSFRGPTKFFGNYLRYCLEDTPDTIWLNVRYCYDDYDGFPYFSRNAGRMVWTGGTVTYLCLQLAYYMGFSEVYLIGFDHSYSIPESAVVQGTAIRSTEDDPNHFNNSYFGSGYRWHDPRVDRMELAYARARQVFEASGRSVYNATVGGHLDVFERRQYASLFDDRGAA